MLHSQDSLPIHSCAKLRQPYTFSIVPLSSPPSKRERAMPLPSTPCPCGSNQPLSDCCGRWLHHHQPAPTAEALMRSRYSAYVLGEHDYIRSSWHPDTCPQNLGGTTLHWIGLQIIGSEQGGEQETAGRVEFTASYVQNGEGNQLHETSRFVRENGQWLYVDGECQLSKIARNADCPCGSQRKFKRCCQRAIAPNS